MVDLLPFGVYLAVQNEAMVQGQWQGNRGCLDSQMVQVTDSNRCNAVKSKRPDSIFKNKVD